MVPTKPESILQEADRIINGERRKDYGPPLQNFSQVGLLWTPILYTPEFLAGEPVTAEQVALCQIQLKISRYMNGKQRDSIVDMAGYAGTLELIAQDRANG